MRPAAQSSSARGGSPRAHPRQALVAVAAMGESGLGGAANAPRPLPPHHRLAKAYLLKQQLAQLWTYTYEGAAYRFLTNWLRALRWQRLPAFQKLGALLMRHLTGLLNYCHAKVPFGKVEAINGNTGRCSGGVGAAAITSTSSSKSAKPPRPAASVKPHDHRARYSLYHTRCRRISIAAPKARKNVYVAQSSLVERL